jgi:error-prone DNA polymerase
MRGLTPQRTFIAQSKKMGMTHLALTETNGLWGFIRFVQHARDADILPVAGANILTLQDDVIVLAENQTGYENLCRVLSNVHDDETLPFADILKQNLSGLFILSHQKNTLKQLIRFVPNSHLFVELRPGITESQAHKLSKTFNLEIVATGDVYFLQPEDWQAHRILRAI